MVREIGPQVFFFRCQMGLVVKVRCPVCGFGHSTNRILGKLGVDRPLWPVEVIVRWVTSGGRGKIQTHYAELPQGQGEELRIRVLRAMLERLRWAVETLETLLGESHRSSVSLTAPSVLARDVPSFASIQTGDSSLTFETAPTTSRRRYSDISIQVPVRSSS